MFLALARATPVSLRSPSRGRLDWAPCPGPCVSICLISLVLHRGRRGRPPPDRPPAESVSETFETRVTGTRHTGGLLLAESE